MNHTFQLEDLTCPSCVKKIEKVLQKTEGVHNVDVRFNASKVNFDYNNETKLEKVKDAIESVGFKVLD